MNDAERRRELADFLRTRRARLSPARAGLEERPRRRTPGLRREEVAELADIGIAWYTWLEQGREIRASAEVLERVSCVLQLDPDERLTLFLLARQHPPPAPLTGTGMTPALQRFLERQSPSPAYITNHQWDLVAWNEESTVIFGDFRAHPVEQRNIVWLIFTDAWTRRVLVDWEGVAQRVLALFRLDSSRHPSDSGFTELTGRLLQTSSEFRQWWPCHEVLGRPHSPKELEHPLLGRLALEPTVFHPQEAPALRLTVYSPLPEHDTPAKLRRITQARLASPP